MEEDLEAVVDKMARKEHLRTLRQALKDNLPAGMKPKEARDILSRLGKGDGRQQRQLFETAIASAQKHIGEHAALTRRELLYSAAAVYHCDWWLYRDKVINYKNDGQGLNERLEAANITRSLLGEYAGEGTTLRHKKGMHKKQCIYFENSDKGRKAAQEYVDRYLIKERKKEKAESEQAKEQPRQQQERRESYDAIRAEQEAGRTLEEERPVQEEAFRKPAFEERYGFDKLTNGTCEPEDIDYVLKEAGLRQDDKYKEWRRSLARSIKRDYHLQELLSDAGTHKLNPNKIRLLAHKFLHSEEFRKELKENYNLIA